MDSRLFKNGYLQTCWEANEVCAQAKSGSLTRSNTDGGRDSVKDGKHDGGEDGERGDLIKRKGTLRDKDGGGCDNETLDEVLDDAINNFSKSVAHHDFILTCKKKTHVGGVIPHVSLKHHLHISRRDEF